MSFAKKIDLLRRDWSHLIHSQHHPSEHRNPHVWTTGKGIRLTNSEGETYIDGLSSMWNVYLGHGRKELGEAAKRQYDKLAFATAYAGATNEPAVELADKLSRLTYPNIKAFFFTLGGSDATDTSVRTARFYWQAKGMPEKVKVISRKLSYHGSTIGASALTAVEAFSQDFGPRTPNVLHIESPYPYRFKTGRRGVSPGVAAADLLEEAILHEGPDTVAAFIAEPVQGGGGGVIVPPDDYFPRIREICDRYGILFISDEVITGFGRTGRWFALEHWGVKPDIVQFAKGITSGYFPLGGVGVSDEIKSVLDSTSPARRWWHGYTASAHPVGCAVALETLRILEEEKLVSRADKLGKQLLTRLSELKKHPHVGNIRGLGLLAAVELVEHKPTKKPFDPKAKVGERLKYELLQRGLLTRLLDETICLAPPLVSTPEDIDEIAGIVIEAVHATFRK